MSRITYVYMQAQNQGGDLREGISKVWAEAARQFPPEQANMVRGERKFVTILENGLTDVHESGGGYYIASFNDLIQAARFVGALIEDPLVVHCGLDYGLTGRDQPIDMERSSILPYIKAECLPSFG